MADATTPEEQPETTPDAVEAPADALAAPEDTMEVPSPEEVAVLMQERDSLVAEVAKLQAELTTLRDMEAEVPGLREALDAAQKQAEAMMAERDAMAAEKEGMVRSSAMEKAGLKDPYRDYMCGEYDKRLSSMAEGEEPPSFSAFLDEMKVSHSAMFTGDAFSSEASDASGADAADVPAPAAVGNPANTVPKTTTASPDAAITKGDLAALRATGKYGELRAAGQLVHLGIYPI